MFQEKTFQARKVKKDCSEKISYISGNGTFLALSSKIYCISRGTYKARKPNKKICSEEISCLLWRFYNLYSSQAWTNSLWSKNATQTYNIITASWKTSPFKQFFIPLLRTSDENTKNNGRHKGSCWTLVIFSSEVINFEQCC